jgi:hypothetical protein
LRSLTFTVMFIESGDATRICWLFMGTGLDLLRAVQ